MKRAVVPGSYDPVTLGHLAIIERAARLYDEVYVVAFINPDKEYAFSVDERVSMLMLATEHLPNVLVSYSSGLVIDYMREHSIDEIVKGYRNRADYEYELLQAEWNMKHGGYKTVLWQCEPEMTGISSTLARKALTENNGVSEILPEKVIEYLKELDKAL